MTRALESAALRGTEGATLRALESDVTGAVVYADDFNRADGDPGANWLHSGNYVISTNRLSRGTGGSDYAVANFDCGSPDHWVEADAVTAIGLYTVINARTSPSDRGLNTYIAYLDPFTEVAWIGKVVGGGFSTITSAATGFKADPNKIRLECEGTALRFYFNGTLVVSTTDPSLTSGNYCGTNANENALYDNFRCGPLPYTP